MGWALCSLSVKEISAIHIYIKKTKHFGLFDPLRIKISTLPPPCFMFNNEKIKGVPNCPKWRENWSKVIFEIVDDPPPQKNLKNNVATKKLV